MLNNLARSRAITTQNSPLAQKNTNLDMKIREKIPENPEKSKKSYVTESRAGGSREGAGELGEDHDYGRVSVSHEIANPRKGLFL